MKNYVLYNTDGEIKGGGQCTTAKFNRLGKRGELILEGIGNDGEHKIEEGKIVLKKEKKIKVSAPIFLPAIISQEQWLNILKRLDALENA